MAFVDPASFTWSGALYETTGPWFGAMSFNSADVAATQIGTITVSVPFINQAKLTYDVNGLQVVKTIQRQSLVGLNFNGTYAGTLAQQGSGSTCAPQSNTPGTPASIQISQTSGRTTVVVQTAIDICTYAGTYTQGGHLGQVAGEYTCASFDSGTFTLAEMAVSWFDFRARTLLNSNTDCSVTGVVDGLRQPQRPGLYMVQGAALGARCTGRAGGPTHRPARNSC